MVPSNSERWVTSTVVRQVAVGDGEAVVLAGDLDLAGGQVLDRMVGAVMAVRHLLGPGAQGQAQHLVAEADAEHRLAGIDQLGDLGHGIGTGGGRVARAVGQENAVGLERQHLLGRGGGRQHGDAKAGADQRAQDVALDAVVQGHDVRSALAAVAIALGPVPAALVPAIALPGGHLGHQIHADQARPGGGLGLQLLDVELAVRRMGQGGVLRTALAQEPGDAPGVDAGDGGDAVAVEPGAQRLGAAPARRRGDVGADHHAAGHRGAGLDILGVGAHITDVRKGEGDNLASVGRIG